MRKILVVDDDPDILELTKDFLESHNIQIITTTEGLAVLELAIHEEPDLILLDIVLPDVDGIQVLKTLRSNTLTAFIPVIMLTGQAAPTYQVDGLVSGADDYVTKPFDLNVLYARVLTVLRRSLQQTRSKQDETNLLRHLISVYEKRGYEIFSKLLPEFDDAPPGWKGYFADLIIRKHQKARCFSFENSQSLMSETLIARFKELMNLSTYQGKFIEVTIIVRSQENHDLLLRILKENLFPFKTKIIKKHAA